MKSSKPMYIAAVSDIHGHKYFTLYVKALNKISSLRDDIMLFIFAGDIVFRGNVDSALNIIKVTREFVRDRTIVACIGNEEYDSILNALFKRYSDIIWLNDSYHIVDVNSIKIAIVGSRGVLDRPTLWQSRNIPGIEKVYMERVVKLRRLLEEVKRISDIAILVTHYTPTFRTLIGEPKSIWPEMGSTRLEKVIIETRPHIVVHGHAHNSKVPHIEVNGVRIYNVALPATKRITLININTVIEKRGSLLNYLRR